MNALIVGADKTPIFEYASSAPFLFIDDGPLIDQPVIPERRKAGGLAPRVAQRANRPLTFKLLHDDTRARWCGENLAHLPGRELPCLPSCPGLGERLGIGNWLRLGECTR